MRFFKLLRLQVGESVRHSRWLVMALLVGLALCFAVLLRGADEMFPAFFEHFSSHYSNAHVTLSFSDASPQALEQVQTILEGEGMVDYYLLTDCLEGTDNSVIYNAYGDPLRTIRRVSTVCRTSPQPEGNLYAQLGVVYGSLCGTPDGEPAAGTVYLGYNLSADDGAGGLRIGEPAPVGGQSLLYQCTLNTVEFDALVSQEDFARYGRVNELTYVVSPFASRRGIDRLNGKLCEALPGARTDVSFTPLWTRLTGSIHTWNVRVWLLVCAAALLACVSLFAHILTRKSRTLALTRLTGCRRGRLAAATVAEMDLYTLTAYTVMAAGYLLYQALIGRTWRAMRLGLCMTLPLLGLFLLLGAVFAAAGVCGVVFRVPAAYRTAE